MLKKTIAVIWFVFMTTSSFGIVIENDFSFVGWQDYSVVSPMSHGTLGMKTILCASICLQNSHCQMYYICRINDEDECFLSFIYDENTTQNGHLPCKAYKFRGDCAPDDVYDRNTGVCLKCSPNCAYKDCNDTRLSHGSATGEYSLTIGGSTVPVRCDMDVDGGGWIVIQRRLDGSVNFYRDWNGYKNGFGSPSGEYWLGLENLHTLTSAGGYILRIDMEYNGQTYYAQYSGFTIASKSDNYRMDFSQFLAGNAGDSLSWHNSRPFTTKDRDHDTNAGSYGNPNCAIAFYGAWWYAGCHNSNLNGHYGNSSFGKGINWSSITGFYSSLSKVEMKIRKN